MLERKTSEVDWNCIARQLAHKQILCFLSPYKCGTLQANANGIAPTGHSASSKVFLFPCCERQCKEMPRNVGIKSPSYRESGTVPVQPPRYAAWHDAGEKEKTKSITNLLYVVKART